MSRSFVLPTRRNRARYEKMLQYLNRWFDTKGLITQSDQKLLLDKVYVQLRVQGKSNPQDVPTGIGEQQNRNHYQERQATTGGDAERADNKNIWSFLEDYEKPIVILGPPGSGKTTLLRDVVLELTRSKKSSNVTLPKNSVPILLYLRNLVEPMRKKSQPNVADLVNHNLEQMRVNLEKSTGKDHEKPDEKWIIKKLKNRQCVIMLDGLDEVADTAVRGKLVKWVQEQFALYEGNKFIVTSRPGGYIANPLKDVNVLEVLKFDYKQQDTFIQQWYLAHEIKSTQVDDDGVRIDAFRDAQDLIGRIRRSSDLSSLATNPLTLTMIANVHRYSGQMPHGRVELYSEICDVFLGKRRNQSHNDDRLTSKQKVLILQLLAFRMMEEEILEIDLHDAKELIRAKLHEVNPDVTPSTFLHLVEDGSGLFVEVEREVYSFSHKTFQEYLAACYIKANPEYLPALVKNVGEAYWHETIRLYVAIADATEIIRACIDLINLSDPNKSTQPLQLGIECLNERLYIKSDVENEFRQLIQKGLEHRSKSLADYFRTGFLNLRLDDLIRAKNDVYYDKTLIMNAEYQLFIDKMLKHGRESQPDHWTSSHFASGEGHVALKGIRAEDAKTFCEWLTELKDGEWLYRLPYAKEVGEYLQTTDYFWVVGDDQKIVSNNKLSPSIDYRDEFKKTAQELEKILSPHNDDELDEILKLANLSVHLINSLDRRRVTSTWEIDDQLMDLGFSIAETNARNIRHINELIDDYEIPSDWWTPDTEPSRQAFEARKKRPTKPDINKIIERVRKDLQLVKQTTTRAINPNLHDFETVCSFAEQVAINLTRGLQRQVNIFSHEIPFMEHRKNVYRNVHGLSSFLQHAGEMAFAMKPVRSYEELKNIGYFEDLPGKPTSPLSPDDVDQLMDTAATLTLSNEVAQKVAGLLVSIMVGNATLSYLIPLINMAPDEKQPKRILLQHFIKAMTGLLINRLYMYNKHRKVRTGVFRIRTAPLLGDNKEVIESLLSTYELISHLQQLGKQADVSDLEGIMIVKELQVTSVDDGAAQV